MNRAGPVTLALNSAVIRSADIRVIIDGAPLGAPNAVAELAAHLQATWRAPSVAHAGRPQFHGAALKPAPPAATPTAFDFFAQAAAEELYTALAATDIFRSGAIGRLQRSLSECPSLRRIAPRRASFISRYELDLPHSHRIGSPAGIAGAIQRLMDVPIRIATSPAHLPALGIIHCLKEQRLAITAHCGFTHSGALAAGVLNGTLAAGHEGCLVNIPMAAHILARRRRPDFLPLMFMPSIGHALISYSGATPRARAAPLFGFMEDFDSTVLTFERRRHEFSRRPGRLGVRRYTLDGLSQFLDAGEPGTHSILPFPYSHVRRLMQGSAIVPLPHEFSAQGTLLLLRRDLHDNPAVATALICAVRDAWLRLIESQTLRTEFIESLLASEPYLRFLSRLTGLFRHPNHPFTSSVYDRLAGRTRELNGAITA